MRTQDHAGCDSTTSFGKTMFNNLSNYFDAKAREVLRQGLADWHALKKQEDWHHWLGVGKAIAQAQDIATRVTGQSFGHSFNQFMKSCYDKPTYLGEFAKIDKSARSYAVKC